MSFQKQTQHYQSVSLLGTGNVHDTFIASVEAQAERNKTQKYITMYYAVCDKTLLNVTGSLCREQSVTAALCSQSNFLHDTMSVTEVLSTKPIQESQD